MGAFCSGFLGACSHVSREKVPLKLAERKMALERAAIGESFFREAVESGLLGDKK